MHVHVDDTFERLKVKLTVMNRDFGSGMLTSMRGGNAGTVCSSSSPASGMLQE